MFGQPKGWVKIKPTIEFSKHPPKETWLGYDMEEDYFSALRGKIVTVIDVAVDGSSYLVYAEGEKTGGFIWSIDKRDTVGDMLSYELKHQLLDSEPDMDDIIRMLDILQSHDKCPCANFFNQAAINEAIREHNLKMGEELYVEGDNACMKCLGRPIMGAHRICFKAK